MGRLSRQQEGFNQFALATDRHSRETLEPMAFGHFRVHVAPVAEQAHLIEAEFALPDPKGEVLN